MSWLKEDWWTDWRLDVCTRGSGVAEDEGSVRGGGTPRVVAPLAMDERRAAGCGSCRVGGKSS